MQCMAETKIALCGSTKRCTVWQHSQATPASHGLMCGVCLQFSQTFSTIIQVGNATLTQSDLAASNGVIHVIQNFPCTDTAFNNTMMATLELAGDFGPFDDAKVGRCICMHQQLAYRHWSTWLHTACILPCSYLDQLHGYGFGADMLFNNANPCWQM